MFIKDLINGALGFFSFPVLVLNRTLVNDFKLKNLLTILTLSKMRNLD